MKSSRVLSATLGAVVSVILAVPAPAAESEVQVQKIGETLVKWSGPQVEAVLSYRFAKHNPSEPWLLLTIGMTGQSGKTLQVKRGGIRLTTPAGQSVPLATQKEFGEASVHLQAMLARATIDQEPVDYWLGRRPQRLGLFVMPGEGIAYNDVWVNDRTVAVGPLFFHLPGGTEPGTYQLDITAGESHIQIPFTIAE
jgi:hypothetical protein